MGSRTCEKLAPNHKASFTKRCMKIRQKKALTAEFTFHNVGQGLFYTGKVGNFNFIYDCGSERRTHLYSVISSYKNYKLTLPRVDLLILSHLHDDHVAGLNALFSNGISIDTTILPYLLPIERLMVALRKNNLPLWFYEFLADPVNFLIEKGVKRVILLGGREAHSSEQNAWDEEGFESEERRLDLSEMPDDEDLRKEVLEKDSQLKRFLDEGRLLIKSHRGRVKAIGMWFFRFFNCKVEDSKLNLFKKRVKSTIRSDDLINVIRSKSRLKNLKNCYKVLQKDFNDTSLIVYHAPIASYKLESLSLGRGCWMDNFPICLFIFPNKHTIHLHEAIGHLLTGDINLNNKWAEIRRHYDGYFSKVSLALVPHHGAKRNWNNAILTKIPRNCAWVACSGISNKYGHPSFEVIQDAIRTGSILYWCNELNKISIHLQTDTC